MRLLRPAAERGHTQIGWLDSWHSFSFSDYSDEHWEGFRNLRVINDDVIAPGQGFGTHGHRDMEIITWVLDGALEHRDSLGSGGVLRHGDVQVMTAGSGIRHSEFNGSKTEPVRLLQLWILPDRAGHQPRYGQIQVPEAERTNRWAVIAASGGRTGALPICADATILTTQLTAGTTLALPITAPRHGWLQVARGAVQIADMKLKDGDGLAISGETGITVTASTDAELLFFDLA
ncbi:MAG: pirin family protein [Planctomycetota bacterium]|mgnify:CR=1 FL=1